MEGPHLAQLLPAASKFRLRRVTLPLATNLGFCPAVADGGVAKGICLCLAECLECLCIKAVLSAAGSGWIGCGRLGGKEAGLAAIPEARTVHAIGTDLRKLCTRLATRALVCNIVEGCCCKLRAGGRAAGIGRAGGSS